MRFQMSQPWATPSANPSLGAHGIVAPAGLPDDIRDRLIEAMTEVYNSDDYQDFMSTAGFGLLWAAGDDFGAFMAEQHERNQGVIQALGLVD
jgi:tripartite-type tricarboxylate transporter receptor subunit TctC